MSDNPLQPIFLTLQNFSNCIQTHVSNFLAQHNNFQLSIDSKKPVFSISSSSQIINPSNVDTNLFNKGKSAAPVTKEELGRATWTFLHTLAAQYPENPTRQQKKDVKELMGILSRMYPCKECADHFKEVLRVNPVQAGSHAEFSRWLCYVHNVVNRSIGKLVFPCERVDARWGKLECEQRACDLQGITSTFGD
ncbi:FAD-linked sulfhydryl oxidase ERV1 [Mercurialis annua]|uniref:FAD-linked sulfhydryl oxidase ERV1 n=1 Tax=Mercurialis annua TaxID=3986 RepID=UPI00215EE046|nr:FAD-linked sulfhydryl oxidase ERV1 [Mercurialis annua]